MPRIIRAVATSNLGKTPPYYNERFHIEACENGLSTVGKKVSGQTTWSMHTEACRSDDGCFLRQEPGLFRWLPFDVIVAGMAEEADTLIQIKVVNYRRRSKRPEANGTVI